MKRLLLTLIFALNCTIYTEQYIHTLITYNQVPRSTLNDYAPISSYFMNECIAQFGSISLSFALPCVDLVVVYAIHNDDGAILYLDKRRCCCYIEYFAPGPDNFKIFKKSLDEYLDIHGVVEDIDDDVDEILI